MDSADALAKDAHSVIFSIGLGTEVIAEDFSDNASYKKMGATLLNYIARSEWADASELRKIFLTIANKIGTILTK